MSVTIIGGLDRLQNKYTALVEKMGHRARCLGRNETNFREKIGNPDFLIIFTNRISHSARLSAMEYAKSHKIDVHMLHSCGLSSLKNFLESSNFSGDCNDNTSHC